MSQSEPFEDPVKTETPKLPHTVASPTSLPDSTPPTRHAEESEDSDTSGARPTSSDFTTPLSPDHLLTHTSPTLVPFLCRTARMAVRVLLAMSPSLSASIAEVAAMSDSSFQEKVDESFDSDSKSEDAVPTAKDDGPAVGDEGLATGGEDLGIRVESLGLGGDEVVPEGQQWAASVLETAMEPERPERVSALRQPTLTTWIDLGDDKVYIDVPAYPPPALPVQTSSFPEWSSGLLPVSPTPSIVLSPISSPMMPLTVPSPIASPATAEAEGFLTEGAITRSGAVRDEIFSQRYRLRILEHEQERVVMENQELRLQITKERHARLDLAEIVDSMRRGQEPRGDV
ncbi:hypothetical protein Tco_0126784 [Tanacetum coccineum]